MARESGSSTTPWLAFIVGGLLVAVGVIGYFAYTGQSPLQQANRDLDVTVELPEAPRIDPPPIPEAPVIPDVPTPSAPNPAPPAQ